MPKNRKDSIVRLCDLGFDSFVIIACRTEKAVRDILESETARRNHRLVPLNEFEAYFSICKTGEIVFEGFGPETERAIYKAIGTEWVRHILQEIHQENKLKSKQPKKRQ